MRPATECWSERTWRAIRHRLLALTSADSAGCSHTKLDFCCLSELTPICSVVSQSAEHTIPLVQQCGCWGFPHAEWSEERGCRGMEWPPHPSFLSSRTSWLPGFQREENYSPHMQPVSQSDESPTSKSPATSGGLRLFAGPRPPLMNPVWKPRQLLLSDCPPGKAAFLHLGAATTKLYSSLWIITPDTLCCCTRW